MFGNLVSTRDIYRLCERLPHHAGTLARRLLWSGRRRTVDTYSRPAKDDQWWSIPAVLRRWNKLVTGDEQLDHYRWLADRYLPRSDLRALSVGCGEGARELRWARTGRFRSVLGIDLSPYAIDSARRAASAASLADVVRFEVGDLADPTVAGREPFDVIIGEHSIHHLSPLREVLQSLRQRLVPGGLVLIDEFVGPSKFQWTQAQLDWINRLLPQLPERLRRRQDGSLKHREYRPSRLYMRLNDPSEAVESAAIVPLLDELFERVELRPYGGAILHMLLSKIGHHFQDDDAEAMHWLQQLATIEDECMARGELPSDFVVGVWRRRP
jgi:SAM-dependent methyltransferase